MRWPNPWSSVDHLLVLLLAPGLLFLLLWWRWTPAGGGGLWLLVGQLGGGFVLLASLQRVLLGGGGSKGRALDGSLDGSLDGALDEGRLRKAHRLGFLGSVFFGVALLLAGIGEHRGALVSLLCAVGLYGYIWRQRLVWWDEVGVWRGFFPMQRALWSRIRHIWQEGGGVYLQEDDGRGFLIELKGGEGEEGARLVQRLTALQRSWLARGAEAWLARREEEGVSWRLEKRGADEILEGEPWLKEVQMGRGEAVRRASWRFGAAYLGMVLWVAWWLMGGAKAWGMMPAVTTGLLSFFLGLAVIWQLAMFPVSWWCKRCALWSFRPIGRAGWVFLILALPSVFGLWVGALWEMGRFWRIEGAVISWELALLALSSGFLVASDPSGIWVWWARDSKGIFLRRVGWYERFPLERAEVMIFLRGHLYWREGQGGYVLPLFCVGQEERMARGLLGVDEVDGKGDFGVDEVDGKGGF